MFGVEGLELIRADTLRAVKWAEGQVLRGEGSRFY